ncbi:hypothetical protein OMP38_26870 [Cohnella ginsengisoli]|uniref:Uncharacterized protein n=1 Tax=Cohnella ginsengisoli TaxID=425004 RepID=A0A9X4QPM0_9BACL|nr:hypothetical protein [Cohnella ginsengisoli]MDG0794043.1 hypothetical protein [Cohnella ginsengisoli]
MRNKVMKKSVFGAMAPGIPYVAHGSISFFHSRERRRYDLRLRDRTDFQLKFVIPASKGKADHIPAFSKTGSFNNMAG